MRIHSTGINNNRTIVNSLEKFFAGIADTMRTFPKHEIANIKLQISTFVGQAENDLMNEINVIEEKIEMEINVWQFCNKMKWKEECYSVNRLSDPTKLIRGDDIVVAINNCNQKLYTRTVSRKLFHVKWWPKIVTIREESVSIIILVDSIGRRWYPIV